MNREVAQASDAGVALWRRIADDLERAIADGTHPAGSRLPGETEIAERFGVNRHTVRRAIAGLAERGLVRATRGSGTYVAAQRIAYPISTRTRFSEIVGTKGYAAGGRMLAGTMEPADTATAARLNIAPGESVVRIDALRHADKIAICIATTWLPGRRFAGAERIYASVRSMTKTLARFGVSDYRRRSTRILTAAAEATDAAHLGLAPGRPILLVDSVDVDDAGRPVLATRARFAADRVEFVVGTEA
ncbi:MAG: phosphonate metabolism transcriptional regulator PhnF [Pseudorhodoplanes sp.]|nr:phosphonate metabolism transcriptional regulator PhnF [Pseudorhodoplanes sp.]